MLFSFPDVLIYIIACDFYCMHSLWGPSHLILTCRSESFELGRPGVVNGVTVQIWASFSVTLFFHSAELDLEWTALKGNSLLLFSRNIIYRLAAGLFFCGFFGGGVGPTPARDLEAWRKTNVGVT